MHEHVNKNHASVSSTTTASQPSEHLPPSEPGGDLRLITFRCRGCRQVVTQLRSPILGTKYCSETCEAEAQRRKARLKQSAKGA